MIVIQQQDFDVDNPLVIDELRTTIAEGGHVVAVEGGVGFQVWSGRQWRGYGAGDPGELGAAVCRAYGVRIMHGANALFLGYQKPYHKRVGVLVEEMAVEGGLPQVKAPVKLPAVVRSGGSLVPLTSVGVTPSGYLGLGAPFERAEVDPAYPHLRAWLSDIHFTSPIYKANLYGWILSLLARSACREFPFLVLDATSRKQGKSTLCAAISQFLVGHDMAPITHTGEESEFEKRLSAYCNLPGPNLVTIDNVRPKRGQTGTIRSQFLAVAATNPTPCVRGLYRKRSEPIYCPVIVFTMNGASLESDLYDRSVRVVLTGEEGRYFDPSPLEYAVKHRTALLSEALTILEKVDLTKRLTFKGRMGTFERIAVCATEELGLMANYDPDAVSTPDAVVRELVTLIEDMHDETGEWPKPDAAAGQLQLASVYLPELHHTMRRSTASTVKARGKVLEQIIKLYQGRTLFLDGKSVRFLTDGGRFVVERKE
jgi:hypothetical protein